MWELYHTLNGAERSVMKERCLQNLVRVHNNVCVVGRLGWYLICVGKYCTHFMGNFRYIGAKQNHFYD